MRQSAQLQTRSPVRQRLWLASGLCLLLLVSVGLLARQALPMAAPFLVLWATAPALHWWIARPLVTTRPIATLSAADRHLLRATARKTWRFFDVFVTEEDNFLPPDNYQEDPRGVVAHRTSPTNIGLYLLSVVGARDLAFITLRGAEERLNQTLSTLEGLEKYDGHVLNWYDTTTLRPLEPQYVSTVDSGNLAAYLWTLREACVDLAQGAILAPKLLDAAQAAVRLALAAVVGAGDGGPAENGLGALDERLQSLRDAPSSAKEPLSQLLSAIQATAEASLCDWGRALQGDARYWLAQAEQTLTAALAESRRLAPAWEVLAGASRLRSVAAVSELAEQLAACLLNAVSPALVVAARARAIQLAEDLQSALSTASLSSEERSACERELDVLIKAVELGADNCHELVLALSELGSRATALAEGMDFRFLFDVQRELFAIGYNISSARLDASHYDLLASEARLGSLFCIAKGDVPQNHWFRLGRPRARMRGGRALLSWSGSAFEYLMPLLVMRSHPDTLLDEGYHAAIRRHRQYGCGARRPLGHLGGCL